MIVESKNTEAKKPVSRKAGRVTATQSKFLADVRQYGTVHALFDHQRSIEWLNKCLAENSAFKTAYYEVLQLTEKQVRFLQVYRKKMTNIQRTCEEVKINRSTYTRWVQKSERFREEVEIIREELFDDTISVMHEKMFVDKNVRVIIRFMLQFMKKRGYKNYWQVDEVKPKPNNEVSSPYQNMSIEELDAEIKRYEKIIENVQNR